MNEYKCPSDRNAVAACSVRDVFVVSSLSLSCHSCYIYSSNWKYCCVTNFYLKIKLIFRLRLMGQSVHQQSWSQRCRGQTSPCGSMMTRRTPPSGRTRTWALVAIFRRLGEEIRIGSISKRIKTFIFLYLQLYTNLICLCFIPSWWGREHQDRGCLRHRHGCHQHRHGV